MEESKKRRERLQAIRSEAAASQSSSLSPASSATHTSPAMPSPSSNLSNPLAQAGLLPTPGESTPPPSRFDFYTDPMSAFSGSKHRSGRGGHNPPEGFASPIRGPSPMTQSSSNHLSAGARNYHMVTPVNQFQMNQCPDQSSYGTPQHAPQSSQWRNPVPFGSPFSGPEATPISSPGVWNRSGGSSGPGFPPSSSRGGYMSPNYGRGGSPMNNSGRGSPLNNSGRGSPMNNSGRGSPHGRGNYWPSSSSPNLGQGRGRGRRVYDHGSAHQSRKQFHTKSMMKDPWRKLKPVVGSILAPLAGPGSWLPKSLTTAKKAKIEESGNKVSSQSSLAECLALSFEEAINEADA